MKSSARMRPGGRRKLPPYRERKRSCESKLWAQKWLRTRWKAKLTSSTAKTCLYWWGASMQNLWEWRKWRREWLLRIYKLTFIPKIATADCSTRTSWRWRIQIPHHPSPPPTTTTGAARRLSAIFPRLATRTSFAMGAAATIVALPLALPLPPPPDDDHPRHRRTPLPLPSPPSFAIFSHDGRRRRGGLSSRDRSLLLTTAGGGAGGGCHPRSHRWSHRPRRTRRPSRRCHCRPSPSPRRLPPPLGGTVCQ